jgi:hypothetical protein
MQIAEFNKWCADLTRRGRRAVEIEGAEGGHRLITSGPVFEGDAYRAPDAADSSPVVLEAGASAEVWAGEGLLHGGACTRPLSLSNGDNGTRREVQLRCSLRATSLLLVGPCTAAQALAQLSRHVALECGRNWLLLAAAAEDAEEGQVRTPGGDRWLVPSK